MPPGDESQGLGIMGERGHVVDDSRPGIEGGGHHGGVAGIDGQRHAGPRQPRDDGENAAGLRLGR